MCTEWGTCHGRLVLMSLEGAMAWTSLPYNMDCPSSQEAKVHFCIFYIFPSMCALPRIPSSPPDQCQRWTGGGGRVAVLYCFFYTSHSRFSLSPSMRSRNAPSLTSWPWAAPAAELQSILEQVYQFCIQVYKSEPATYQVLS